MELGEDDMTDSAIAKAAFMEAELKYLRDELTMQMKMRDHSVDLFLLFSGTVLGIALKEQNALLSLVPAFFSLPFFLRHSQKHGNVAKIATYIGTNLEDPSGYDGWETVGPKVVSGSRTLFACYPLLIFTGTDLVSIASAIVLGWTDPNPGPLTLFICIAVVITLIVSVAAVRFATTDHKKWFRRQWDAERHASPAHTKV